MVTENIEEKERIDKVQAEKDISEEEAKKDVAKTTVEEITGKSAETVSNEIREAMEAADALATGDINKIKKEMGDTNLETLKKYQSDMEKYEGFADKAALGLGSGQLAIIGNGAKVAKRIDEVVSEMETHGEKYNKEDENKPEKKQGDKESEEIDTEGLYPPHNISQQPDGRIIDNLEQASKAGQIFSKNTLDKNNVVENVMDEAAGKLANEATKKFVKRTFRNGLGK